MTATMETDAVPRHRVGKFEFEVRPVEDTDGGDRWQRRSDALTRWLLAEWQREQRRQMAERN